MHAYVRAMYDKSMDDMDAEIKSSSGHQTSLRPEMACIPSCKHKIRGQLRLMSSA